MNSTSASPLTSTLLRALPRFAVLLVLQLATFVIIRNTGDDSDWLGYGIASFGVIAVVCLVWAIVDGARHPVSDALLPWLPTALLFSVLSTLGQAIIEVVVFGSPLDQALFVVGAPLMSLPFSLGLVIIPTGVGILMGHLIRGRSRPVRTAV